MTIVAVLLIIGAVVWALMSFIWTVSDTSSTPWDAFRSQGYWKKAGWAIIPFAVAVVLLSV